MFNVKLIRRYSYNVVVKGYSKINSLGVKIRYTTNKIVANLLSILKTKATITDNQSRIEISNVSLKTNMPLNIKDNDNNVSVFCTSKENISSIQKYNENLIIAKLRSREKIKAEVVDKVKIILNPTVGYFRKLVEFDSLTLEDLDDLTLEEMDIIISALNYSVTTERKG